MVPFLSTVLYYKYLLAFFLAIFEGPTVMILGGLLLKLGYFSFWPLYIVLMAGDLTADIGWYALGYFGARPAVLKYGRFLSIDRALIDKTEKLFKEHPGKILFTSKITTGFGLAPVVLATAGISRVPFRKYLTFNILGQFIWTGFLMTVGYLFGQFYETLTGDLRIISVGGFVILIIACFYGLGKYLSRRRTEDRS